MLGLTDSQLTTVMDMARVLPVEKRSIYLKRIAAMLMMRGRGHFNDADVGDGREVGTHRLGATASGLRKSRPHF